MPGRQKKINRCPLIFHTCAASDGVPPCLALCLFRPCATATILSSSVNRHIDLVSLPGRKASPDSYILLSLVQMINVITQTIKRFLFLQTLLGILKCTAV